ncbi:hypothetical protein HDV64DRAFT_287212 [Trichoderma sp. TUCIM 5745]
MMALPRWPSHFIILCLISLVQAYTVFETNCSAPATLSNYVSSPNTRGTLDILWSSLFTIFACTWTIQHPNVPEQREVDDHSLTLRGWRTWIGSLWRNIKWGMEECFRSTLRMLWTVIAPELIISAACIQLIEARENEKKMKQHNLDDRVPWTRTHSYYANMGGFVVRNPSADKTIYHDPYHLTGQEIFELREGGHIAYFPSITEAEIMDKSKGDMLGKLIALGQIVWSVCQIIARLVRKLPVSPLEVAVVAFAVCAVFIYVLYWKKPQRVGVTHTIQLKDDNPLYSKGELKDKMLDDEKDIIVLNVVSFSAALFGGIHAIAWDFPFPSTIELIFWRCASIYTAAAPLCSIRLLLRAAQTGNKMQYMAAPTT